MKEDRRSECSSVSRRLSLSENNILISRALSSIAKMKTNAKSVSRDKESAHLTCFMNDGAFVCLARRKHSYRALCEGENAPPVPRQRKIKMYDIQCVFREENIDSLISLKETGRKKQNNRWKMEVILSHDLCECFLPSNFPCLEYSKDYALYDKKTE